MGWQVRVVVERLARRLGYDAVAANIPEEHSKLLTHIRKEKARKLRDDKADKVPCPLHRASVVLLPVLYPKPGFRPQVLAMFASCAASSFEQICIVPLLLVCMLEHCCCVVGGCNVTNLLQLLAGMVQQHSKAEEPRSALPDDQYLTHALAQQKLCR